MATDLEVVNNRERKRFEVACEGEVATLTYRRTGENVSLDHTEVPKALEGRGIGSLLARAALEAAREADLEVVPLCPFIVSYIRRHPEFLEVVEPRNRERLSATN